jgi:pimeloyl-ACP methyl ester carboxylesterase
MIEIIERHAEYVSKKAAESSEETNDIISTCNIPEIATYKPGTAKLQYLGFSYGTYLGATFASMYPERVGRVILDGVVNSDDYNYSLGNGSLVDAEKAMKSFYTFCLISGPDACPLATSTSSLEDIERRVQTIIRSLYHNPIPLYSDYGPEVLTFTDLKLVIFSALYQPQLTFPQVTKLLAAVEARGGPILDQFAEQAQETHVYQCSAGLKYSFLDVAIWAILCADGDDVSSETIQEFEEYWNLLNRTSPTSGSIWTINRLKCAHWKIRPTYRYTGQFGGNTSHPILWMSNTADPVTPLRSARIMSERFPGSVVLTQDAAGVSRHPLSISVLSRTSILTGLMINEHLD